MWLREKALLDAVRRAEGAESKVRQQAAVIRQLRLTVAANSKVMLLTGCHRV